MSDGAHPGDLPYDVRESVARAPAVENCLSVRTDHVLDVLIMRPVGLISKYSVCVEADDFGTLASESRHWMRPDQLPVWFGARAVAVDGNVCDLMLHECPATRSGHMIGSEAPALHLGEISKRSGASCNGTEARHKRCTAMGIMRADAHHAALLRMPRPHARMGAAIDAAARFTLTVGSALEALQRLWAWHAQMHLLAALHMSDGAFAIADAAAAASHMPVVGVVCLCYRAGEQRHIDHT